VTLKKRKKKVKFFRKNFQKGIDKGFRKWYNNRAAVKKAAEMILEN